MMVMATGSNFQRILKAIGVILLMEMMVISYLMIMVITPGQMIYDLIKLQHP